MYNEITILLLVTVASWAVKPSEPSVTSSSEMLRLTWGSQQVVESTSSSRRVEEGGGSGHRGRARHFPQPARQVGQWWDEWHPVKPTRHTPNDAHLINKDKEHGHMDGRHTSSTRGLQQQLARWPAMTNRAEELKTEGIGSPLRGLFLGGETLPLSTLPGPSPPSNQRSTYPTPPTPPPPNHTAHERNRPLPPQPPQ